MQNVVAKWAPPNEKGKFSFTVFGGTLGTVVTWPIAGFLMEGFGWRYGFYVPAIFTVVMTVIWFTVVYNTPAEHPGISLEEKVYIASQIGNNVSAKTVNEILDNIVLTANFVKLNCELRLFLQTGLPPLICLLKSVPVWVMVFLHYGNLWAFYFLLTGAPKYMNEVLKFNLSKAGILASLPYLSRVLAGFLFGAAGDYLTKNKIFPVAFIRKSFCIFCKFSYGFLVFSFESIKLLESVLLSPTSSHYSGYSVNMYRICW